MQNKILFLATISLSLLSFGVFTDVVYAQTDEDVLESGGSTTIFYCQGNICTSATTGGKWYKTSLEGCSTSRTSAGDFERCNTPTSAPITPGGTGGSTYPDASDTGLCARFGGIFCAGGGTVRDPNPFEPGDTASEPCPASGGGGLQNPLKFCSIESFLLALIDIVLILAVPIIIFFIIYAGFLYVTAQGDPGKIETATRALTYAIIGGLLILGARALIAILQNTVDQFMS